MAFQLKIDGSAVGIDAGVENQVPWDNDDVIAIGLDSGSAEGYLSRDGHNEPLEGVITFGVNGQETIAEWTNRTETKGQIDLDRLLLYAGRANVLDKDGNSTAKKVPLQLGCEMIESDEGARKRLEQWGDGLGFAGQFSGLIPGYGTAISAGLGLARSVLNLIKDRKDDDTEMALRTTLLPYGETIQITRQEPKLNLALNVHHLRPGAARPGSLVVEQVEFDIENGNRSLEGFVLMFELTCGAGEKRRNYTFQHTLDKPDNPPAGASQDEQLQYQFQHTRELKGAALFNGEMKYGVPIRFSARLIKDDKTLKAISTLAADSGTFAANFLSPGAAGVVNTISKAEPSFRSFILPLLTGDKEFPLGTFDGYLFPGAPEDPNVPYLRDIPAAGNTFDLIAKGKKGSVKLTLRVV